MKKRYLVIGALIAVLFNLKLLSAEEINKEISGVVQNATEATFIVQSEKERIEFRQIDPQVKIGDRVLVVYTLTTSQIKINKSGSEAGKVPDLKDMIIDDRAIYHATNPKVQRNG